MRAWALLLGVVLLAPAVAAFEVEPLLGSLARAADATQEDPGVPLVGPTESSVPCLRGYVDGVGSVGPCAGKAPGEILYEVEQREEPAPVLEPPREAPAPAEPAKANESLPEPVPAQPAPDDWTPPTPPPETEGTEAVPPLPAPAVPREAAPRPASIASAPQVAEARWPLAAVAATGAVLLLPVLVKWLPMAALRRRPRQDPPAQRRLLAVVAANPGIHHAELRRQAGLGNGTVEHYVRRLEKAGALLVHRTAGNTCYVLSGAAAPAGSAASAASTAARHLALRNPVARRLLELLGHGPLSLAEMGRRAGAPLSTVHYHVVRMERAGLLRSMACGRERLVSLVGEPS